MTNYKKIENEKKLREAKTKYKEFIKSLDLRPLVQYFEVGLEAEIFLDNFTKKILTAKDNLVWGFTVGKYQYMLARRPIIQKHEDFNVS